MKFFLGILVLVFFSFIKYKEEVKDKHLEKYTSKDLYELKQTDPLFVSYENQYKLTYKINKDNIKGRFLYDQEDFSNDYQIHAIYMLASDSVDRKLDVNDFIKNTILYANKKLELKTVKNFNVGKKLRLDRTKNWKIDISFLRLEESKEQINSKKNIAGYLTAMMVRNGFYDSKKIYSIFYQGENKQEMVDLGGTLFRTSSGKIEVVAAISYLENSWRKDPQGPWSDHLRGVFKALGHVQLCAPGVMSDQNSIWDKNYYLKYWNDIMSDRNIGLKNIDKKGIEYYGHNNIVPKNRNCELDLKKSAYLEPSEKDFQLQPRTRSCKISRKQRIYNHQKALNCLSKLRLIKVQ
jgi:hypothetical protein